MVYPGNFHRVVLGGTLYSETFNTTFSVIPRTGTGTIGLPPAADVLAPLATLFSTFWSSPASSSHNLRMNNQCKLTSLKVNLIGTDGRYVLGTTSEHIYTTPVAGAVSVPAAPQLASVVTLRTDVERGLASKGRMFFPASDGWATVDPDGRVASTHANRMAASILQLFTDVNAVYATAQSGDEHLGRVGVASKGGAGMFREVELVSVGRVVDTIRSRRTSLDEAPVFSAALP